MIGIGACILYVALALVYYSIWEPTPILIGMTAITVALTLYASKFKSRLLMNIAVAAALLAPLFVRPELDQSFPVYLYLLVLNCAFIYLSYVKKWMEVRFFSYAGTWLLYLFYFIYPTPPMVGGWSLPISYALSALFSLL